jgi:hypothetical protein
LGNPSIQSSIYFVSLVLCIQYEPFGKIVNIIVPIIFIIAILLTVTSTAIIAILLFLLLLLFDKSKRAIAIDILAIGFLCVVIVIFLYGDKLKLMLDFFLQKWDELIQLMEKAFFSSDVRTESSSFNVREIRIQKFLINLRPINILFGDGKFGINYPKETIENLYFSVFHDYGIVGLIFLIGVLVKAFFSSIYNFIKTRKVVQLIAVLSFSVYGITLIPIIAFNMAGMFVLLFYFSFWTEKHPRI